MKRQLEVHVGTNGQQDQSPKIAGAGSGPTRGASAIKSMIPRDSSLFRLSFFLFFLEISFTSPRCRSFVHIILHPYSPGSASTRAHVWREKINNIRAPRARS